MGFVLLDGKGISAHISTGAPKLFGVSTLNFEEPGSGNHIHRFELNFLGPLQSKQETEGPLYPV